MRTVEEIDADIRDQAKIYDDAQRALWQLRKERDEVLAAKAEAEPHPLAGQLVEREVPWGYGSDKRKQTGIVTLFRPGMARLRNHRPKPGEWFVKVKDGCTAYSMNSGPAWKPVAPR